MLWLKWKTVAVVAAWATTSACTEILGRSTVKCDSVRQFAKKLSPGAQVYFPGTKEFDTASERWSVLDAPTVNAVVVPATENDVVETVKFANSINVPFLAYNTAHGAMTTLGNMEYGIEIWMHQLSSVKVSSDGKTATIGGGTKSKNVTDTLWAAGKQAVTGTCECVSYMGPALGGGHGWLQGHHGLIADQWVSMNIVLADGTLKTINANSDLWWAMKGAGHNFGIVTSITVKIFDIQYRDWAIETIIFSGDKIEEVYTAVNNNLLKNGTQPEGVINWSYWLNNPAADPNNPIILFWIIQEGVKSIDPIYSKPFHDIGPIVVQPDSGDYRDLATWTGIALDSPPCQKAGLVNPRFPLYLQTYDIPAMREAYDLFASNINGNSPFNGSLFLFEGYSNEGVKAIDSSSAVFAFRDENLLTAPLISYAPAGADLDQKAKNLGEELRNILFKASGKQAMGSYVNYAYGDETPKNWYGSDQGRQNRLKALKQKYDPKGKFSFFGPVA